MEILTETTFRLYRTDDFFDISSGGFSTLIIIMNGYSLKNRGANDYNHAKYSQHLKQINFFARIPT